MTINVDLVSAEMNFGQDAWDDSTILDIFDDAIRSHKTKKDTRRQQSISDADGTQQSDPNSKSSSEVLAHGSWTPVADIPVDVDVFNGIRGSNTYRDGSDRCVATDGEYSSYTMKGARSDKSPIKSSARPTPREKTGKTSRTASGDTNAAHRATPNTHTSPSSSSGPQDECYAAEEYNTASYENQFEQLDEEDAASATLEESFNGMLMAWYQSGYATGRYQALLELSKKSANSQCRYQPPLHPQPQHQGQRQNRNTHQPFRPQSQPFPSGSGPHPLGGSHR